MQTEHLATGAVKGTAIANQAIGSSQIANGAVGSTQIASNSIARDRLAPLVVVTNGLPAPAGAVAVSGSSGAWIDLTPTVPTIISNFDLTITTRGNPVEVLFVPDGNINSSSYFLESDSSGTSEFFLVLLRNGVGVGFADTAVRGSTLAATPPGAWRFLDLVPPGLQHYQVQIYTPNSANSSPAIKVQFVRMIIREL